MRTFGELRDAPFTQVADLQSRSRGHGAPAGFGTPSVRNRHRGRWPRLLFWCLQHSVAWLAPGTSSPGAE